MKIQSMFQKDIDRPINGVVKVMQDDQQSLKDELSEYIITKELRRHFATFFDNYVKAIDTPTDKIGVWISGFFGSGKSHFLKMLSYLLSNKEVDGKHAFDYFADKFDDPMMYATVQKCVRIPTESILFNIDIEGPINKDKTAVLRVFAKVFYNHYGFYGEDLKVAKLERFIDKQGKTEAFRAAFKEVNGDEWVNARDSAAFFEDDVVEVLQSVLGMSETAARNWFNGEENADMSIKQLVSEIKEYVDSKEGNFRLLFCVDEVGQYIGDDGDLMMNLQSLVEEIGDKCRGKVWVMVTSQEAIDSVVKITGNDFSKIQGRFNTRLSLSSSSVDEVIKKRVLAKTEDADHLLQMEYEKEASGLKSLFAFDNPILDIKGFTSAAEFSATFPFVPYQFIVIQKVLAEIRKHALGDTKTSQGNRTIILPESVAALLRARKKISISQWIFPQPTSPELPMNPGTAYRRLKTLLVEAGLPSIRFHDLRHTFATHALTSGVDAKTLAGILGHTNASFTLDTYTHVTPDMREAAGGIVGGFMEDLFGKELKPWQRNEKQATD